MFENPPISGLYREHAIPTLRAYTVAVLTMKGGKRGRKWDRSQCEQRLCPGGVSAENRLPELLSVLRAGLLGVPHTLPSLQFDSMTVSGGTQFYVHLAKTN